jgi:hypothetical protein
MFAQVFGGTPRSTYFARFDRVRHIQTQVPSRCHASAFDAIDIGYPERNHPLTQGTNARSIEGRRVVEPSRGKEATYRITFLTGLLLSMAMLLQPAIAAVDDGDTATVTIPSPGTDTGLREPSITGPVVIHGTRPVSPAGTQSPNVGSERTRATSYRGFQPVPHYGSGWNTDYNFNGLDYTPWNAGQ